MTTRARRLGPRRRQHPGRPAQVRLEWGPRRLRQLGHDPVEGCACTRHALLKKRRDPWHRERAAAPIYNRATGTAFRMPIGMKKSRRCHYGTVVRCAPGSFHLPGPNYKLTCKKIFTGSITVRDGCPKHAIALPRGAMGDFVSPRARRVVRDAAEQLKRSASPAHCSTARRRPLPKMFSPYVCTAVGTVVIQELVRLGLLTAVSRCINSFVLLRPRVVRRLASPGSRPPLRWASRVPCPPRVACPRCALAV